MEWECHLSHNSMESIHGLDIKWCYSSAMCKLFTLMTQCRKYTSRIIKLASHSHCHDGCVQCVCFSSCAATVTAVYATSFTMDFPFDPQELIVFAVIGWVTIHYWLQEVHGVLKVRNVIAWGCYNSFICCFVWVWNLVSVKGMKWVQATERNIWTRGRK
jgi:hypothetical protein